jgi:cytochrome bd-type quinol oxidase subunit 2
MKKNFFVFFIIFLSFIAFTPAFAQEGFNFKEESGIDKTAEKAGYMINEANIYNDIANVIQIILTLTGIVFLAFLIYGGYVWMMARGDEAEVQKAINIIRNSLIGLIVVLSAYAILQLISILL